MIVVEPAVVMSIPQAIERKVFACLWLDRVDSKEAWVFPSKERLVATGFHRQTIWQAMVGLEAKGFIRRRPGSKSWSVIAINPLALRDSAMTPKQVGDEAMLFKRLPTMGGADEA